MSLSEIYPVIITRDAAQSIERTLASLRRCPEVVVYDNGSTDETLSICRSFTNVRLTTGEFFGFGPTKKHATGLARGEWVLSIDADEYLSDELVAALEGVDLSNPNTAYAMLRGNLFMGRRIDRGSWGNDWLVRLFHRNTCGFNDAVVHEKLEVPSYVRVERVSGALWHAACSDIDELLHKISRYSDLERGKQHALHSPFNIWLRSRWAFVRSYLIQGGWREGWRGLVIANCIAQGSFFKHMKRYVDEQTRIDALLHGSDNASATKSDRG
jgi:glycosyltransferase involved in cell wall biosynthesis